MRANKICLMCGKYFPRVNRGGICDTCQPPGQPVECPDCHSIVHNYRMHLDRSAAHWPKQLAQTSHVYGSMMEPLGDQAWKETEGDWEITGNKIV